ERHGAGVEEIDAADHDECSGRAVARCETSDRRRQKEISRTRRGAVRGRDADGPVGRARGHDGGELIGRDTRRGGGGNITELHSGRADVKVRAVDGDARADRTKTGRKAGDGRLHDKVATTES